MKYLWSTVAHCNDCGLVFENIEPGLIVLSPEVDRSWIICPCCLQLKTVNNVGENMKKKMLKVDSNITGEKLFHELCEKKDYNAILILDTIRRFRAQMGLAPIKNH